MREPQLKTLCASFHVAFFLVVLNACGCLEKKRCTQHLFSERTIVVFFFLALMRICELFRIELLSSLLSLIKWQIESQGHNRLTSWGGFWWPTSQCRVSTLTLHSYIVMDSSTFNVFLGYPFWFNRFRRLGKKETTNIEVTLRKCVTLFLTSVTLKWICS